MTLAPSTCKRLQEAKSRQRYALELVNFVRDTAKHMSNRELLKFFVDSEILNLATISGIVEIVKICLQHFPDLIWLRKSWKTVLHVAIEHRQELIFNLIYNRSALCKIFAEVVDQNELIEESSKGKGLETENQKQEEPDTTKMHLAATLAPSSQLLSVPGKALQMQRELPWFKEVEKLAHPSDEDNKDKNGYTPRELFTEQHKDLVKEAEKWMKDTSTSCMVVTTLVATVVFASAFTLPGGNNSNEEDFLKKLPLKLLLGLASLFFAIATMMIAFVAAIWIVFHDRFNWVSFPVIILASIPVTVFLSLQLPLFIQIYKSTFTDIFRPEKLW
ncbi:hypothetical protein ACOSP7_020147 [Xanthoceras sorbifolium]